MSGSRDAEDAVREQGQFAYGVCRSCGWVGPARRSRGTARRDRAKHDLDAHEAADAALDE